MREPRTRRELPVLRCNREQTGLMDRSTNDQWNTNSIRTPTKKVLKPFQGRLWKTRERFVTAPRCRRGIQAHIAEGSATYMGPGMGTHRAATAQGTPLPQRPLGDRSGAILV